MNWIAQADVRNALEIQKQIQATSQMPCDAQMCTEQTKNESSIFDK